MHVASRWLRLASIGLLALPLCAWGSYVYVQSGSLVNRQNLNWGTCLDPGVHAFPRFNPLEQNLRTSLTYAGYRSMVQPGSGPLPCHHASDFTAYAVNTYQLTNLRLPEPQGPSSPRITRESLPDDLERAVLTVREFRSRNPEGIRSGPMQCAPGEICRRPTPQTGCQFSVFMLGTSNPVDYPSEGGRPVNIPLRSGQTFEQATTLIRGGRGFFMVNGASDINGGVYLVTEEVRQRLRTGNDITFLIGPSRPNPSTAPEHRMKNIECDGSFAMTLQVDFRDRR